MNLIPVFPGRPAVLVINGATVYLSLRDQAHLAERRSWRLRLRTAHPDSGDGRRRHGGSFRRTLRQYRAWLAREAAEFVAMGVPLPPTSSALLPPPPVTAAEWHAQAVAVPRRRRGRPPSRGQLVTLNGVTKPLTDWVVDPSLTRKRVLERLRLGWTIERALTARRYARR